MIVKYHSLLKRRHRCIAQKRNISTDNLSYQSLYSIKNLTENTITYQVILQQRRKKKSFFESVNNPKMSHQCNEILQITGKISNLLQYHSGILYLSLIDTVEHTFLW